jgi:hypothetical protein
MSMISTGILSFVLIEVVLRKLYVNKVRRFTVRQFWCKNVVVEPGWSLNRDLR